MDAGKRRRWRQKRTLWLKQVAKVREFLRGSLVRMIRRCGRPGCRRGGAGEGHPTWVLTVSERGKTRTVYVGEKRLAEARRLVENYRRLTTLVEALSALYLEGFQEGLFSQGGTDGVAEDGS